MWPKGLIKKRLEGAISRTISLHCGVAIGEVHAKKTGTRTLFKNYPMRFCNKQRIFIDILQRDVAARGPCY